MFDKILIANRGEIALRVIRACREMGVASVAVHSTADSDAMHVRMADEAICIGPPSSTDSYLSIPAIISACEISGAQAIHPGYGFLSENARFVQIVEDHGLIFIGPTAEHIRVMGDKITAKDTIKALGVPCVPGSDGGVADLAEAKKVGEEVGYPVIVKATAGGGGRGMKVAQTAADMERAFQTARSEAKAAFGNDEVYIEKYLTTPRHIEVQVFGDGKGKAVHLGERDCSLQRRHQKVLEEAPGPCITEEERARIGKICSDAVSKINYAGAGTIEFLYENGEFYFIEMNTRLQVEHPVTEAITGIDLVEWQLRIARGEALTFQQSDVRFKGHAIEVRIAAENPAENYRPETGTITLWAPPSGVRLDTGVGQGSIVGHHYDSMLAKLIIHAPDRAQAIRDSVAAIDGFAVGGVGLNLAFQRALLMHPDFAAIRHHTTGLGEMFANGWTPPKPDAQSRALAALALHLHLAPKTGNTPWQTLSAWRLTAPAGRPGAAHYWASDDDDPTRVAGDATQLAMVLPDGARLAVESPDLTANRLTGRIGGVPFTRAAHLRRTKDHWQVFLSTPDGMAGFAIETLEDRHLQRAAGQAGGADLLVAPMPGAVVELRVAPGDRVEAGDTLVVLEAMKLLQSLVAPVAGIVAEIYCAAGDTIAGQAPLVKLDPEEIQ